jgi:hypothetical protein
MNVTGPPVLLLIVCSKRPGVNLLEQVAIVFSGLKNVTRLEVKDALDSVTPEGTIDFPGTKKSPPLPGL